MRKTLSIVLAFILMTGLAAPAYAANREALNAAVEKTAAYMYNTVKNPQVDSVGGEWAVIGLARSGYDVPDSYYENYYRTVERYIHENGAVLHDRRYTDNSRVILGLTAAGYDPRDVSGHDLTIALGDFERTIWQGINGPTWALIALDSLDYPIPVNPDAQTQATRELYIAEILRRQTPDGGWNLTAGASGAVGRNERGDAGLTGMVLQAFAKYQDSPAVRDATDEALTFLSEIQDAQGGFSSGFSGAGADVESSVQVLVALCEIGIPLDDPRFVKNGHTLIDNILSYANTDGSFKHQHGGGGNNQMSTEQALYALVSAQRALGGMSSLYRMSDAVRRGEFRPADTIGLPNRHKDVSQVPIILQGKTFHDIIGHNNQAAIEALAERGIITGKSDTSFDPDATMTRAEFAAIVTRGLGLDSGQWVASSGQFEDVPGDTWYFGAVQTAYHYGIVNGTSAVTFNPNGTITRQEAAVMITRAAGLAGMNTDKTEVEIRDTLAAFGDYRTVVSWAQEALAFCYAEGILDDSEFDIQPGIAIRRCEIAQMLYMMLVKANLL